MPSATARRQCAAACCHELPLCTGYSCTLSLSDQETGLKPVAMWSNLKPYVHMLGGGVCVMQFEPQTVYCMVVVQAS